MSMMKSEYVKIVFLGIFLIGGIPNFSFGEATHATFMLQKHDQGYRLIIESPEDISYKLLPEKSKNNVCFQFNNVKLALKSNQPLVSQENIKIASFLEKEDSFLSLMSLSSLMLKRVFPLPPTMHNKHYRLVIDVFLSPNSHSHISTKKKTPPSLGKYVTMSPKSPGPTITPLKLVSLRPLIILDPGHGGVDPGSIGPGGSREKDITLRFTKILEALLLKTQCCRVYLTRDGDYFISLRDRLHKAQELQGDLFLSLHADSNSNPHVRGISIYTLSEEAATEHAKTLVTQSKHHLLMNKEDVLSENKDATYMLLDFVKRDTAHRSSLWATYLIESLSKEAFLLNETRRSAGFKVLKGLDMPSLLIELGQISHKAEETLLNDFDYHMHLSKMIVQSIERYLASR